HGPFLACARYPECRNTRSLRRRSRSQPLPEKTCEKCGSPLAIRTGRRGRFVACTGYPKCRNTRPIRPDDLPAGNAEQEIPDDVPPSTPGRREKPPAARRSRRVSAARSRPEAGKAGKRAGARRRS
ncbi:MAG: topoisomerase DNA-binding C4 zinc finger domain-containing protein, partial [Planctomycetes bacterium]|nr:topoisomerase DNA-binding C4 zinc finger domain-containing protein [Planctomycetota bacterium]